ncbi:MAG: hypothetical protein ACRDRP_17275 [Pseudonocardiaceae bacterium]
MVEAGHEEVSLDQDPRDGVAGALVLAVGPMLDPVLAATAGLRRSISEFLTHTKGPAQ